jgi:hypothetical protein
MFCLQVKPIPCITEIYHHNEVEVLHSIFLAQVLCHLCVLKTMHLHNYKQGSTMELSNIHGTIHILSKFGIHSLRLPSSKYLRLKVWCS